MEKLTCKICGVPVGYTENEDIYKQYNIECYCENHFPCVTVTCTNCGLIIGDIPIDDLGAAGWWYDGCNYFCYDCTPDDKEEYEEDEEEYY